MKRSIAMYIEGGPGVGLGHAARSVGLAHAMQMIEYDPIFLIDPNPALSSFLEAYNYVAVPCVPTVDGLMQACSFLNASGLIIDSYRFYGHDLSKLMERIPFIACFDDIADRELPISVVINGSAAAPDLRYNTKVDTKCLLGVSYQIIRPDFISYLERQYSRYPTSILVTFGGDDLLNIFGHLLLFFNKTWRPRDHAIEVNFIVGPFFKQNNDIEVANLPKNLRLHYAPKDIRSLMLKADIAVSAGGQTLYELARCGTPTVGFCVSHDQLLNLLALSRLSVIEYIGWAKADGWLDRLGLALDGLYDDASFRETLGRRAANVIDGRGARRVAEIIHALLSS